MVWRQGAIGNLLFRLSTGDLVAHLNQPGEQTPWVPVELQNEIRLVFGLPAGRSLQVGTLSEKVVVHENDGKVASRNTLAMDDAYRVANDVPPVHDPLSGVQRMLWASLSNAGEVFVCLSGVPLSKPANIAQFDPMTGHLVKVIEAQLPRLPERVDKYNPDGFIGPFLGAVDDRIVIADGPLGLVAVYKLN